MTVLCLQIYAFNNIFRKNVLCMASVILYKLRLLQYGYLCSHKEMERNKFNLHLEKQRDQEK